jgi:DNA-binding LacI/PurR family transcriptional regulator
MMPVTAKEIARQLDLSQSTVSRILSGDERQRATDGTRQRVLETAQRLGYQPNAVARSLRNGRTNIIGVHTNRVNDVRNDFYGTIIGALQQECGARRLDVLLHSALRDSPAEEIFGKLRDGRIDGLILHTGPNDPLAAMLSRTNFPVVSVADSLTGIAGVTCDDADGMRQLVEYLKSRGYERFVLLAPEVRPASVKRRSTAFLEELEKQGCGSATVLPIDFEQAEDALSTLLAMPLPVAVCCWNDGTAYRLLRACAARGVLVPQQLAVTGFDGFRDEKLPARELVTVACPWNEVAATALEVLMGLIEGRNGDEPHLSEEICLPVTLLHGDTA